MGTGNEEKSSAQTQPGGAIFQVSISSSCACTGKEQSIAPDDFDGIPSYTGVLYSFGLVPDPELDETWITTNNIQTFTSLSHLEWSKKVRSWVREAALYHGIPHVMLAQILQHENGKNVPNWKRIAQSYERKIQTLLAEIEEKGEVKLPWKAGTGAAGSTGICNMSRKAFQGAAQYIKKNYCKSVLPDNVRYAKTKMVTSVNTPFITQ